MNNQVLGDKLFYIHFTREEITHVQMDMALLEADYIKLKAMTKDEDIAEFIYEKQKEVRYTPGATDVGDFYEWAAGKECVEGEGERGIFDFKLEKWVRTPAGNGSRLETSIHMPIHTTTTGNKADPTESYARAECTCGWRGKWRSCMNNWQVHDVSNDKRKHHKEVCDAR